MSSLPPCSTRRRRVVRDPSLGLALARRVVPGLAVALALALAAPNAVTIAAESAAGEDAGDELRASRRLRERAASLAAVTSAAPSALSRDVGQIAILEHDGSPYGRNEADGTPNYTARAALAQRFYQTHGDNYDFIVVFTNFEFETGGAIAFHSLIRNEVAGINKPVVDNGPFFGSPGRLHGFVDMAAVDRYTPAAPVRACGRALERAPGPAGVARHPERDGARDRPPVAGPAALSRRDGGGERRAAGPRRGALELPPRFGRLGDVRVRLAAASRRRLARRARAGGLLAARPVPDGHDRRRHAWPPFTLLRNPRRSTRMRCRARATSIAAIARSGEPRPGGGGGGRAAIRRYELAPKTFRAAFVFLTSPGVDPDPEDLAAVDRLRAAFVGHFFALTGGVGLVDTTLAEVPPEPTAPAPDLDLAVAWLLAQQQADGSFEDLRGSAVRDTGTVLETLREIGLDADPYARAQAWLSSAGPANSDFLAPARPRARPAAGGCGQAGAARRHQGATEPRRRIRPRSRLPERRRSTPRWPCGPGPRWGRPAMPRRPPSTARWCISARRGTPPGSGRPCPSASRPRSSPRTSSSRWRTTRATRSRRGWWLRP